jgi:hypothetical protein
MYANGSPDSGDSDGGDSSDDSGSMNGDSDTGTTETTGTTQSNTGLNPLDNSPAKIDDALGPPSTAVPTVTDNGLNPLSSEPTGTIGTTGASNALRVEGNNTENANASSTYNATFIGVPENLKNTNNETAATFANNILGVHNQ